MPTGIYKMDPLADAAHTLTLYAAGKINDGTEAIQYLQAAERLLRIQAGEVPQDDEQALMELAAICAEEMGLR